MAHVKTLLSPMSSLMACVYLRPAKRRLVPTNAASSALSGPSGTRPLRCPAVPSHFMLHASILGTMMLPQLQLDNSKRPHCTIALNTSLVYLIAEYQAWLAEA